MNPLIALTRAIRAELLKMKRTLALAMVAIAPLAVCGLLLLVIVRANGTTQNPWDNASNNVLFMWRVLMMPLFVTLETALIAALDHNAHTWKHLWTLPVPRWSIYLAKQIVIAVMIFVSTLILCAGIWGVGTLVQILGVKPQLNFASPFPWVTVLESAVLAYLASWLIIAIHTFVAMRWPSFTLTIGIGIAAVVGAVWAAGNSDWAYYYPWSLAQVTTRDFADQGIVVVSTLLLGVIGGIVAAVLGTWYVSRRDVLT